MTVDFSQFLTEEQKRSLLEQRVAQFAAEGYQHQLNKQIATSTGDTEAVDTADNAIAVINAAIETYQTELSTLE